MDAQNTRLNPNARALRKKGGRFFKDLRVAADLTQRALAEKVGLDYYTFISQIETGYGRPPAELYEPLANAFGVDLVWFTKMMLLYYDPWIYKALYGVPTDKDLKGL
jgi:transcriptional regulator with XRE-family HTH domain